MSEFNLRRNKLFESLKDNSVALVFSGVSKIKSEDEFFPFYANRNFFYLTGIEQENSLLVLVKTPGENKEFLFVDEYNELKERWTGKRLPFDKAGQIAQIDTVYSNDNLSSMLEMILAKGMYGQIHTIYLDLSSEIKIGENRSTLLYKTELEEQYPNIKVENIYQNIVNLRLKKSKSEVNDLIEACNITNTGINDLLLHMRVGMSEHELSDRFEFFGKTHGRHDLSFETIVGAGKDGTVMHHPIAQQTKTIQSGELVLFDLGFSYNGYHADISRTYPVDGVFSDIQKKIYQAVLNTNKEVIKMIKPGLSIPELQEFTLEFLKNEAVRAGLIKEDEDIKKYYIHNVSHFLGLDTHDVGDRSLPLEAGNVITVEPGLYFVDLGIGVRIEDDVLVTEEGSKCLSDGIGKEIYEVERLLKSKKAER